MRCLLALVAASLCCCGASEGRHVVTARHVDEDSGAPDVTNIVDLGDLAAIPAKGAISTAASDGVFAVGELVLIEGDDFGKLPTVTIGGRPALNLARTKNGGIVSRIPTEVPDGRIDVEVSHPEGRDKKSIDVERYLAIASADTVYLLVSGARPSLKYRFEVGGATGLAFSHDGQALYIAGPQRKSLQIVKVCAKDRPATAARLEVGDGAVQSLVTRINVPTLAALGTQGVQLFDTRVPTAISLGATIPLKEGAKAGVFSPDGAYLAVIGNTGNRVSLIRLGVGDAASASVVAELDLMDGDTVPLLQDLVFAPEGDEIWVVSGNNKASTIAGFRPTLVTRLMLGDDKLSLISSATIAKASGPRRVAVSQRQAIMAAAAVRSTRQRAALILSDVPGSMVGLDTASDTASGQLLRFDLEGNASALVDGAGIHSKSLLSHDQAWVYAATRKDGQLGVTSVAAQGGEATFLELATTASSDLLDFVPFAIAP